MSEQLGFCAYCGEDIGREKKVVASHMLNCEMRPELGLILKIQMLKEMGDNVLGALHDTIKVIAELEGPRATSWEIYRMAQEGWEIAKDAPSTDLAEAARSGMLKATDDVNDREIEVEVDPITGIVGNDPV